MNEEKKSNLPEVENMTKSEIISELKSMNMDGNSSLSKEELQNVLRLKRYTSDRANQYNALLKAAQIDKIVGGGWFTAGRYSSRTRVKMKRKGFRDRKTDPNVSYEDAIMDINVLTMFGLVISNKSENKRTKYKINMDLVNKATEDHNKNVEAQKIINGGIR